MDGDETGGFEPLKLPFFDPLLSCVTHGVTTGERTITGGWNASVTVR